MFLESNEKPIFTQVSLHQCGWEDCAPGHLYGPAVRGNYLIHCVLSGEGTFLTPKGRFEVKAGQGFIIFPGEVTTYWASFQAPWSYAWVGYDGHDAALLTRQAGLNMEAPVFPAIPTEELFVLVKTMCHDMSGLRLGPLAAVGGLCRFMALLAQSTARLEQSPHRLIYEKAHWFMEGNCTRSIRISDVAAFVGLSRSQLFRVYEETCGMSPKESLCRLRMERSLALLTSGVLSREQIASSLGISSGARFAYLFKQHYGLSPRDWQKQRYKAP